MKFSFLQPHKRLGLQSGFTLMEIVVATTVFALVVASLTGLFDYTLRINRRTQALRDATQSMRGLVEFLTKEIRNGQIDYGVTGGSAISSSLSPCPLPSAVGQDTYQGKENRVGILTKDGHRECIYYATKSQNYVSPGVFASASGTLMILKDTVGTPEPLLPSNVTIEQLVFFVRPVCDPFTHTCSSYAGSLPRIQPSLFLAIEFMSTLPTGEQVPIYYQTAISTDKYDVPSM